MTSNASKFNEVDKVLNLIRPAMEADGGGIDRFEIDTSTIRVQLKGACLYCPSHQLTLKLGIEKTLRAHLDWVVNVETI
jgi:Fe-S cluster biogenesis protein NfuA